MDNSILGSIKKLLGLMPGDKTYDEDVLININTCFSTLQQLGVGPKEGFMITDTTQTWDDFIKDDKFANLVKTYVFQKTKLLFDPPASSVLVDAMTRSIAELEWRLNMQYDTTGGAT